ncbi:Tll0287-like domain-containing protein [Teredinibacter haidensis]|uniref:Tll0287-like domain-containing protein n=1 Tax=Teredinibacter haidensis TaxID=2731755 RepID=UPI0009F823A6|nr:DUF3365 domain-containing protein [Teredinibacter haidensis]
MRYPLLMLTIALTALPSTAEKLDSKRLEQSRAIVEEFHKTLGGKLKAAISEGGFVKAIDVCSEQAPALASAIGKRHEVLVKRISDKARNPLAAADKEESNILRQLANIHASEKPTPLEITTDTRYYKGIAIQPLCLACHGNALEEDVKAALSKHYPSDKAVGYSAGDLRGAFVVEWP